MDIRRMPDFCMPPGTDRDAAPVIITLSPREWNDLRDLISEHIGATGWCQRRTDKQRVAVEISTAPRIERSAHAQRVGEDS
jgi:hypothetical protein